MKKPEPSLLSFSLEDWIRQIAFSIGYGVGKKTKSGRVSSNVHEHARDVRFQTYSKDIFEIGVLYDFNYPESYSVPDLNYTEIYELHKSNPDDPNLGATTYKARYIAAFKNAILAQNRIIEVFPYSQWIQKITECEVKISQECPKIYICEPNKANEWTCAVCGEEIKKRKIPVKSADQYIYVFGDVNGEYPYFKIGRTNNVRNRLNAIKIEMPVKMDIIHSFQTDDSPSAENMLHKKYSSKRKNGEWFMLSKEDLNEICRIRYFVRGKFELIGTN